MMWVVFEYSEFFFSVICYIGSGTSQTNDSKKLWSGSTSSSICFPRLTNHHLFAGFPWCLIAIHSLCSFSSTDACAAWRPRLPIGHSFWESVFSQFVEPRFWPKKTEMVLRHSYGQKNCHGRKKLYHFKFKFFSKQMSSIYFFSHSLRIQSIIVYDLKAECTINNFRMFMFDSSHSLLYTNALQNKKKLMI